MLLLYDSNGLKQELPVNVRICDSFTSRVIGALREGRISPGKAYLFPGIRRIHTFFMAEPITVCALDKSGQIIDFRNEVKPYRIFPLWNRAVRGILELAPGLLSDLSPNESTFWIKLDSSSVDDSSRLSPLQIENDR